MRLLSGSSHVFVFWFLVKSSQNKMDQKNFQVHSFRCLFLQLAAEKKTPKTVHLENIFGPSYFEAALAIYQKPKDKNMRLTGHFSNFCALMENVNLKLIMMEFCWIFLIMTFGLNMLCLNI